MNCPVRNHETTQILLDYCAGKLADETAAELKVHIDRCRECRAFAEAQQQVWSALNTWEAEPVTTGFDQRLYERIAGTERQTSWRQWLQDRVGWRAVAPVAIAATVAALLIDNPERRPVAPVAPVQNSRNEPIEAESVERALEDLEMLDQLSPSAAAQDL